MLSIDQSIASAYVSPLGQQKFDKSVGLILMNADLAVSMPEMGGMFREQIKVQKGKNIFLNRSQFFFQFHLVEYFSPVIFILHALHFMPSKISPPSSSFPLFVIYFLFLSHVTLVPLICLWCFTKCTVNI